MGSPVRRQINPIMRCWDQPHYGYAGTDDGRGTDQRLDTKRLTLMRVGPIDERPGAPSDRGGVDGQPQGVHRRGIVDRNDSR